MATADVSPYGNPSTTEQGVQPAGLNTPGTAGANTPNVVLRDMPPEDEVKLLKPLKVGWPRGNRAYPSQHSGQLLDPAPQATEAEQAELQAHYDKLKPEATMAARDYVLSRTPARWQEDMIAMIEADWPLPETPTGGEVLGTLTAAAREERGLPRADGRPEPRRDANPNFDPNLNPQAQASPYPQDPVLPR